MRLIAALVLCLLEAVCLPAYADSAVLLRTAILANGYTIEILKSKRELLLLHGERIARRFTAATGNGGIGDKKYRGDHKTPVGVYYITGFNEQSAFEIFMRLNYPSLKDGFFGLKRSLITREEFNRIAEAERQDAMPPQNTPLGGAIGIHGIGAETADRLKIHAKLDWTTGCIALTNREIRELRHFVDVGTKVVIRD